MKRWRVCIKTRSTLASLPLKGQVTSCLNVGWCGLTKAANGLHSHNEYVITYAYIHITYDIQTLHLENYYG